MADQVVKISTNLNQALSANLNVDGKILNLNLTFTFSEMANYWLMTVKDSNNNVLLDSIPMVTGCFPGNNLLGAYMYLQLGSAYLVNVSNSGEDFPSQNTLARDWQLIWSDTSRA